MQSQIACRCLPPPAFLSHKDYLFQKALAVRLQLDSFRFDFRYPSRCVSCYRLPFLTMHSTVEVRANPVGLRGMVD